MEKTLLEILPENTGFRFSHSLVAHGRKVCKAASKPDAMRIGNNNVFLAEQFSQDPLQLLVASRLSAQCTDVRVNMVTEKLFEKYRTAADFSSALISSQYRLAACSFLFSP
mgnify:CR=1 FL=1